MKTGVDLVAFISGLGAQFYFCIGLQAISSKSAGVDRALKLGRDMAEIFAPPDEQFLILPEGRFSPVMPWLLQGGEESSCYGKGFLC